MGFHKVVLSLLASAVVSQSIPHVPSNRAIYREDAHPMLQATDLEKWGLFSMGVLVGASVELAANVENTCMAGIASIVEATYSIYYYINEYMVYEQEEDLAWGFTYVVKGVGIIQEFDCADGFTGLFDNLFTERPMALQSTVQPNREMEFMEMVTKAKQMKEGKVA
jgi:hypothetical protein